MWWYWILWAVVAAAVVGAIACLVYWWMLGDELRTMADVHTSNAADVARLEPGTLVEVKGTLRCAAPLTADLSKQSCAYHFSEIERETVHYERGFDGKSKRQTSTDTLHSNEKFAPCVIEDESGTVVLELEGATIEGDQVVDREEIENQAAAGAIQVVFGNAAKLIHRETVLPHDVPVYVVGHVQDDRSIGPPPGDADNGLFVVSMHSEEKRTEELITTRWLLVAGAVVLVVAAAGLGYYQTRPKTPPKPKVQKQVQLSVGNPAAFQARIPPARWQV